MITNQFKELLLSLDIDNGRIDVIDKFLNGTSARINPDMIEFHDGSQYYSESYLKEMMRRAEQNGEYKGTRKPVIHQAEIVGMSCPNCGWVEKYPKSTAPPEAPHQNPITSK